MSMFIRQYSAVILMAFFVSGCSAGSSMNHPSALPANIEKYPYYFYESTGSNQFIMVGHEEKFIDFDRKSSDPHALDALFALKWNVLYPNSKGKIFLFGIYISTNSRFILYHWYLPRRFPMIKYFDERLLPQEKSITNFQSELLATDFDKKLHSNPNYFNQTNYFSK